MALQLTQVAPQTWLGQSRPLREGFRANVGLRRLLRWHQGGWLRYERSVEVSPDSARAYEFEGFVREILERSPDVELPDNLDRYGLTGFDIKATRRGRTVLVEVKVTTPQTSHRLERMNAQLRAAADRYESANPGAEPKLVLAIPGVLSQAKMAVALRSTLEVWDGPYLRSWAQNLNISVPPYVGIEETEDRPAGSRPAHFLLQRLSGIEPGQGGWFAYEQFCEELLNFLFVPPLNPAIPQSRDERHANRRDFVLPNYALDGGFWQYMRSHYDAHYVVAEVKVAIQPGSVSPIVTPGRGRVVIA